MKRPLSQHAQIIFRAGVESVCGDRLIRDTVQFGPTEIWFAEHCVDRQAIDRIILVGAGKASGAMAVGMIERYQADAASAGLIQFAGHLNVPQGCERIPEHLSWPDDLTLFAARPAGVNEPTSLAIEGTDRILHWVSEATPRDLVVVLISGGGSALLVRPADGLTLADQLQVVRQLSGGGADITQLNTVRKHLSAVKGGRLAAACRHAPMISLVLSDVLGDPLDLIASGPTVADHSTPHDALEILNRFDPERSISSAVYECLNQAEQQMLAPEAMSNVTNLVIGNNAVAVDAAGIAAESLGYNHVMQSARRSEGTAEEVGRHLADMTVEMLRRDPSRHHQDALITGGEPVVRLIETSRRGKGGRNQQLVLAAYERLLELDTSEPIDFDRLVILSGGTDGEDGPTDAAGAWIDGEVHRRARHLSLNAADFLRRNDAYSFFEQAGGLLMTGPTGTNVCDIRISLVDRLN
ncbi:glycerate kinase type-2 family protein [Neorhodopirellula pilleata]|uniref:glycerate kinase type-2 family protein n=1 Tax=Neorhodopirellula pilleata TaxID=2714738 RepID=UPI0011B7D3CE|nr:DUF4147 domain-containing protein [Neorhodopirellula pilleata]